MGDMRKFTVCNIYDYIVEDDTDFVPIEEIEEILEEYSIDDGTIVAIMCYKSNKDKRLAFFVNNFMKGLEPTINDSILAKVNPKYQVGTFEEREQFNFLRDTIEGYSNRSNSR